MKAFAYRAVEPTGRLHTGQLDAENENALARLLHGKGLELIEAQEKRPRSPFLASLTGSAGQAQKRVFCAQMHRLLVAGLTFEASLQTITSTLPQGTLRDALMAIEKDIQSGLPLAHAFAAHPYLFDDVFLSILSAGESTGDIAATFDRLAVHLERQFQLRRTFVRAVRYPLFLLSLAFGVTTFMMTLVVPQIVSFLTTSGAPLGLMTRLLIALASSFAVLWWAVPLFILFGTFALHLARRASQDFVYASDALLLRVPVWGGLYRRLALARLMASLTLLLSSGQTLPDALAAATATLRNRALIEKAQQAHRALINGEAFSAALIGLADPLYLQMIKIGEVAGHLPRLLAQIAAACQQDAQDDVQSFLGALEPALTLLVGGLLAWIVLAVLGPVYGALAPLSAGG